MEEMIKYLANNLVEQLSEIEKETDFEFLATLDDKDIRSEAQLLWDGINKLKDRLQEI
ncbi:MAG: hypothetical protein ACOX6E_04755 [Syntrophomonadaceae bacterium]|jgi:hypothetical protein